MIKKILDSISAKYPITSQDAGEFAAVKASGMKFVIRKYIAEGLGTVSVMTASGMLGLMKMDTVVIVPVNKDLPLFSYDRIFAMGNDTLITEIYDTCLEKPCLSTLSDIKSEYEDIPERDPGEHWYDGIKLPESISKKCRKSLTPNMDDLALKFTKAFLEIDAPDTGDLNAKKAKVTEYAEGLINNGGPSTDAFIKAIGREQTEKLFKTILFSVE